MLINMILVTAACVEVEPISQGWKVRDESTKPTKLLACEREDNFIRSIFLWFDTLALQVVDF